MSVSIDLLDSMLSGGKPGAEELYKTIPLQTKVRELTHLLSQFCNAADINNNNSGRAMLSAVLLRREIIALSGSEQMNGLSKSAALGLCGEIAESLMSLFMDGAPTQSRRQIGHCIAELCSSLSIINPNDGKEWMKSVLGRLESGVSVIFFKYKFMVHVTHLMFLINYTSHSPYIQCVAMDVMFLKLLWYIFGMFLA